VIGRSPENRNITGYSHVVDPEGSEDSIPELQDKLDRARDDGERAGLHDALGIRLAHDHRFEEALAECTRAVALRGALASTDPDVLPYLAISLTNQGGHLTVLGRYGEAVVAHVRALEILQQVGPSEPQSRGRMGYNACRLGVLLFTLNAPALAARFDGLALAIYLFLAETQPGYATRASSQLNALCLSLDGAARATATEQVTTTFDVPRLSAAGTPAFRTASYLSQWAAAAFDGGDIAHAIILARRTIVYCDLFPERRDDRSFSSLREENRRRATDWSAVLGPTVSTAADQREPDRRLWSITGRQLSGLVGELVQRGFASSDVYALGAGLARSGLYPARDCEYRCRPRLPQVFITYTWSENYVDLQVAVRSTLTFLEGLISEARPELDGSVVEQLVNEKLGFWIDFIFIDQSARRLVEEVREIIPRVIATADAHFVLSEKAILRSWCCYEIALFNQRQRPGEVRLRSFVGRSTNLNYQTFAQTEASQPEDKRTIERAIAELLPGGMSAFDALMMQASLLSDSFAFPAFAQSQAAIDEVRQSIDRWLAL
jgi:hypothetical protein